MKLINTRKPVLLWLLTLLSSTGPLLAQVIPAQPSVGQQPTGAAASGQQPGAQQAAGTGSVVAQPQYTRNHQQRTVAARQQRIDWRTFIKYVDRAG